jgi:hypothetical protein|tara:strand:- start:3712 stop:4410 length:699 start_codon:yes stop_codon:yes gene_type:complete
MSLKITFESVYEDLVLKPKPALQFIPQSYKKLRTNLNFETATVKKCVPVLDALTCGYIIPFSFDIGFHYDQEKNMAHFNLNPNLPHDILSYFRVEGHVNEQIGKGFMHSRRTIDAVFKFSNPWIVKTPPGYSCIFTQPFNRNAPFKIIDGIVDTDTYQYPVFFPFYWTADWKNDDTLEAGSPMVLIIPFKRESWKHETKKIDDQTYRKTNVNHFRSFWNNYRNKFWQKKSFR